MHNAQLNKIKRHCFKTKNKAVSSICVVGNVTLLIGEMSRSDREVMA